MSKRILVPLFFSMVHDFLHVYLADVAAPDTIASYTDALTIFRRYVCEERQLRLRAFTFGDCSFDFVLEFRNWLLDDAGLAPSTANHRLAALKSYMHYAASKNVALEQFCLSVSQVPSAKNPIKIRPVIEDAEALRTFLNAPRNTPLGRRDCALLAILYDAALRVEELTGLRVKDTCLSTQTPHLLIHGKGRKERLVTLSDKSAKLLHSFLEEQHKDAMETDTIFFTIQHGRKNRMSERNVERIVKKYGYIARQIHPEGIPERIYPHLLRRTRACHLYQSGIPVEMIALFLGHASIQTTMDHYAFPSLEQKQAVISKAPTIPIADSAPEWPEDDDEFAKMCGLR